MSKQATDSRGVPANQTLDKDPTSEIYGEHLKMGHIKQPNKQP